MPRKPRLIFEDAFYHVTARGNNRYNIFADPQDCLKFLLILQDTILEFHWQCLSFCLLWNHYHLVIHTPEANLTDGMQKLHSCFSNYFRIHHSFTGYLYDGRYDSSVIFDDAYALESIRYDLLNPVRAGLVSSPEKWAWSSYAETAGLAAPSEIVDNDWIRSMFNDNSLPAKNFIEFVKLGLS